MNNLVEAKRAELLNKSKSADNYTSDLSKGKNRYERRLHSKVKKSVKELNSIDMNKLFKDGILDVNLKVQGETDEYTVSLSFSNFLNDLHDQINKGTGKLELRFIIRALLTAFNHNDVYVHCTCLHPDTRIKLLDGTSPTVAEMCDRFNSGESLYVYSVDENGDFKPGVVEKVWVTTTASKFIRITLDNNESIVTTPEHLYLLRDGTYTQAYNLTVGQSLMPLYFNSFKNGYEGVKLNSNGKFHSVYKLVADYFKSEEIKEARLRVNESDNMKYDIAIHHIDFNKKNNNPENLQPLTAKEHWMLHANNKPNISDEGRKKLSEFMIQRNANPTSKMINNRIAWQNKGKIRNLDEDRRQFQAKLMSETIKNYYSNLSEDEKSKLSEIRRKVTSQAWERGAFNTKKFKQAALDRGVAMHTPECEHLTAEGIRKYWENLSEEQRLLRVEIANRNLIKAQDKIRGVKFSEEHKQKIREARLSESDEKKKIHELKIRDSKMLRVLNYLLSNNIEITHENFMKFKPSSTADILKYFSSIEDAIKYYRLDDRYNHKIIAIEYLTLEDTPVYDIKVKDFHNFLVEPGVILHNCPDFTYRFAYWLTINDINYVKGEQQSNGKEIANPNDTKGRGCKHILLVLSNTSWLTRLASVIYNYVNYMEKHYQQMYADIIYPAIYEREFEETQLDMFSTDELSTDKDTIDTSNKWAKTKSQFKPGNEYRFKKSDINDGEQLSIDELENNPTS